MNYCVLADVQKDSMLKKIVTEDEIKEAGDYIDDLSWSVGIDPIRIPVPAPYKVQQLAIAYTLMTVANNKSIMNTRAQDGEDAFALKQKIYAAKVRDLTKAIKQSPKILLGKNPRRNPIRSVSLERG